MSTRPKYKLKHRPPTIDRLLKYKSLPPPLTDDPPHDWRTWEERCVKVYHWMIARKRGIPLPVPAREQRGLWFHAT